MITAVNYHLWEPCNMRCKFCFATFQDVKQSILPKGHLPKEQASNVILQLAEMGFEKITFAGGEPTLCPWLTELITTAKTAGMTTMIVSNGSKLTDAFLEKNKNVLDWIALSIDSLNSETNVQSGRAISGKTALKSKCYYELVDKVKEYGYGLKINTVVNSRNCNESLIDFINYAQPKRWKIFQVLPIEGQNNKHIDELKIGHEQFIEFVDRHKEVENTTEIIPESNYDMKGSYAMVDPAGRFYDNANGKHNYSKPILEIGARLAILQVDFDYNKFINRGGIYKWTKRNHFPEKITLSGEVASGKTSIGKLLAEKLNYQFISIGNRTRDYANSKGLSITDFQKECISNPSIDKELDQAFAQECNANEKLIIDYRLGFKFINNAYHIFLKINEEEAAKRLRKAKRVNETHHTIQERNETFKKQFKVAYGIDFTARKHYDLYIDVSQFNSPSEIADFIIYKINEAQ